MKHIIITILLVLAIVGNVFAFDWSIFTKKSLSEVEAVRLLGKPSKAGTLYDQVDYKTFTRINKLDIYMLEYDKPLNKHSDNFQSPLGIDATSFMVWFAKPKSYLNNKGNVEHVFSIDFFFSGKDKDRAYAALKFDKKCDNENWACFFLQKCWKVTIDQSKEYKNYGQVFAQKFEDGATYDFGCSKATPDGMYCLDDEVRLSLKLNLNDSLDILTLKKECEESQKGVKK